MVIKYSEPSEFVNVGKNILKINNENRTWDIYWFTVYEKYMGYSGLLRNLFLWIQYLYSIDVFTY